MPGLPESLIGGRQRRYFDFFFDALAADPTAIPPAAWADCAQAYADPSALRAGFSWYRTLAADAEWNRRQARPLSGPLLDLRGDRGGGDIDDYVAGFRQAGLSEIHWDWVPGAGHFSPEEAPTALWALIDRFARTDAGPAIESAPVDL